MAKGNMFQGMARGKVGDVVFSRLNGEQISRVRNRHPKNPRTAAQLYQRAIMATILQAYAAGKEIFDHSFEGKEVGSGNMREFMSRNIKMLRGVIASEVDTRVEVAKEMGRVVAPGSITPVPVPGLIVSQGSALQNFLTITPATDSSAVTITMPQTASAEETLVEYATRLGLNVGDIFTIVAFIVDKTDTRYTIRPNDEGYGVQYAAHFGFARLTVKDVVNDSAAQGKTLNDLFDINVDGEVFKTSVAALTLGGAALTVQQLLGSADVQGTIAIIKSREDSGIRSSATMQPITAANTYGLASWYALEAWAKGTVQLGNSDLLLEGGNAGTGADGNNADLSGGGSGKDPAAPPTGGY